jgi:hypothetical protein
MVVVPKLVVCTGRDTLLILNWPGVFHVGPKTVSPGEP